MDTKFSKLRLRQTARPDDYLYAMIESGELFSRGHQHEGFQHPGFLQEYMPPLDIGIIAATREVARAWEQRILASHEPPSRPVGSDFESITLHTLGWADPTPAGVNFHEVHVLDAGHIPVDRLEALRPQTELFSLHYLGGQPAHSHMNLRSYIWPDEVELPGRFLASLFATLDKPDAMSLDWAAYASLPFVHGRWLVFHGEEPLAEAVMISLRTPMLPDPAMPIRSALLLIEYDESLTFGEYADVNDALTTQLPQDTRVDISLRHVPGLHASRYWLLLSDEQTKQEPG
ncbi:hypothetical protein LPB260_16475 [Pseudomonas sp. LPB0260]|uniref:hypothetical protein n=1 Tax=Pseudomonas sp. LPB0260 TaxID=2614442 RepID=UPI0015C1FE7C|nr:hypothetical protein [Pseudomonas sp. LPB0260]QLC72372.1 hypothetical protein LPB260_01525 [Pseudomonas sp. LPB0260]QLC75148.1 hypothetical protein LPB260_16475 [Pseudomonas sp. LPB0260]